MPERARQLVPQSITSGLGQRSTSVASTIMWAACRTPSDVLIRNPPCSRSTAITRRPVSIVTPSRCASPMSASNIVLERFVSGNSLPSTSCSFTLNDSKNAAARSAGNALSTLRTTREEPPQKSRSVTTRFVTLQREPPLTRILAPIFVAPSRQRTSRCGAARFANIAVANPAAPTPMMIAVVGCQVAGWLDSWDKSANRRSGTR